MGICLTGTSGLAMSLAKSGAQTASTLGIPQYLLLGIGSSAFVNTQKNLTTATGTYFAYTSIDSGTQHQITWTFDRSSIQMSGVQLKEFGFFPNSTSGTTNPLWNREAFPSILFDSSNELQIQLSYQIGVSGA